MFRVRQGASVAQYFTLEILAVDSLMTLMQWRESVNALPKVVHACMGFAITRPYRYELFLMKLNKKSRYDEDTRLESAKLVGS
jgi:hypothetical protein